MGSYARNGRVVITEINRDIPQKFPEVYAVGPLDSESDPQAYPFDDHVWFNPNPGDIYFDFYGNYYRQVETYLGPGTGETILICDSFAAPMIAPLANNYETVHWVDDLFQRPGGTSIEAYIDETHPEDVWIVGIPADMMALIQREPGYFDAV